MSNVSPPSDGGYQYYHKSLSDLEEELNTQSERAKKTAAERADEAERSYRRDLNKKDEAFRRTVQQVREDSARASQADRSRSREELKRFKDQSYDRFGKVLNQERADHRAKQMAQVNDFEMLKNKSATDLNELRNYQEQKTKELAANHDEKLNRTISNLREDAKSTIEQDQMRNREAFLELKRETEKSQSNLERQKQSELADEKLRYRSGLDEMSRSYASRQKSADEALETRQEAYNRAADKRTERDVRRANEAHAKEMGQYSTLIKEQASRREDFARGRAQGYADATREFENEWRSKMKHQSEAYEEQVESWKSQVKETEDYKDASNNKRLRDKERFFTDVIRKRDGEHSADREHLKHELMNTTAEFERQGRVERERNEKHAEARATAFEERTQSLLQNQAESYRDTLGRQRDLDQDRISALSKELQRRSTSSDAADISPAAEESVRRAYYRDDAKARRVDEERTKDSIDSIQKDYSRRLHETVLDKEFTLANQSQEHVLENDRMRREFLNFADESQANHESSQRRLRTDSDRQAENLTKNYASALDKQKRESDLASLAQKSEADVRFAELRDRSEFAARMNQRAFNNQQNELIREYDRKLADQESEHARQMAELKDQTAKKLREGEIETKRALDNQARSYDQRIAQAEMQHKERERIITQNYEDQLAKVKRKNELLISKKG